MKKHDFGVTDNHPLPTIYCREQKVNEKGQLTFPMEYAHLHNLKPGSTIHWFWSSDEIIMSTEKIEPSEEGIRIIGYPDEFKLESSFGTLNLSPDYLFTVPSELQEDLGIKPNASVMVIANKNSVYVQALPYNFSPEDLIRYRHLLCTSAYYIDFLDDSVYQKGFLPNKDQLDGLLLDSKYHLAYKSEDTFGKTASFLEWLGIGIGVFPNTEEDFSKKWSVIIHGGIPKEKSLDGFKKLLNDSPENILYHKKSYCKTSHFLFTMLLFRFLSRENIDDLGTSELYYDAYYD